MNPNLPRIGSQALGEPGTTAVPSNPRSSAAKSGLGDFARSLAPLAGAQGRNPKSETDQYLAIPWITKLSY
jgi:hypothetical protein